MPSNAVGKGKLSSYVASSRDTVLIEVRCLVCSDVIIEHWISGIKDAQAAS